MFCGYRHVRDRGKCPSWKKECSLCHSLDHFAKCCKSLKSKSSVGKKKVHSVQDEYLSDSGDSEIIGCVSSVNNVKSSEKQIFAKFLIDEKTVKFQIDCGASVNILPKKFIGERGVQNCSTKTLRMWNNSEMKPLGKCRVTIRNRKTRKKYYVEFVIINESLRPLLGAQAVQQMKLITVNKENFTVASVGETDTYCLRTRCCLSISMCLMI
jgi:hypothetical protein